MNQINLVLDFYSIAVTLVLVIYLLVKKKWKEQLSRCFILMCAFNLGMLLGDLTNWTCEGVEQPWFPFLLRAGTVLYFGCSAPILLFFTRYIIDYLAPKATVPKAVWYTTCVITALQLLLSVLSLWNGAYFTFSPDNLYMRGRLFWLSQLLPILTYCIAAALIGRYRAFLRSKDKLFLLSYVILPLVAEVVQIMNYGLALMNVGSTFALLLIFINIQSERELLISRQEQELTESRIDIMLSQIQPHFLYNTLTSIRQLCEVNPAAAKDAIRDFSYFLRANMNSLTHKHPISFTQELAHVKHYLSLEQQRYQERLRVAYDIRVKNFSVPPLTLQPIVENAVRHGIMMKDEGGTVTIRTSETEEAYMVTVADDGIGFEPEKSSGDDHIGLRNVRYRLETMAGGRLHIESLPGIGTTVEITIFKEKKK